MGALNVNLTQKIAQMRGTTVYFDTNPIIYITDGISPFLDATLPFFNAIASGQFRAVTSEITLAELLTKPYAVGDHEAVTNIHAFFDHSDFIRLVAHNKNDFVLSAQLRGTSKLKAIDALHIATAINHQCGFFITADKDIAKRAHGIEVVDLNDFVA